MKILARKAIRKLTPYEPGKPMKELERELGISESDIIKLASNENPIGPSPKAVEAMRKSLRSVNRYPDGSGFYLKQKLASKLKVKPYNIVLGNGSDELIDIITKAFLEEHEEVLISDPAFLEYKIITMTRGSKVNMSALKEPGPGREEFRYDIKNVLGAITKKTRIVFLGNPDNPTGAYIRKNELNRLLKLCPKDVILVFDEAYREFTDKKDYANPAAYINKKNIIILRTFSKAYGLAGVRVGYALSNKELSGWMERARQPFNVNLLAQAAAEAALDDRAHIIKSIKTVKKGMRYLSASLKRLGFDVIEGPANFILFSLKGKKGTALFKILLPEGIIIRDMKAYGLHEWARVNAGTMAENRRFIRTIGKIKQRL